MKADGSQANPQDGARKPIRRRGCLIAVVLPFLLLLVGIVRIYRPRFASSIPTSIGVEAPQFAGNEDYRARVTNANACRSVIASFEQGTLTMPCMCKEYARFAISYGNGTVDHVKLLSGHSGPEFFQIRIGLWQYRLPRKDLGRIMEAAGVDESKLFAYEGLLYSGGPVGTKNQAEQAAPSDGYKPSN